jgi:hypothetical protein
MCLQKQFLSIECFSYNVSLELLFISCVVAYISSAVVNQFLYCNVYCVSANVIDIMSVVAYIICLQWLFSPFVLAYILSVVVIQFLYCNVCCVSANVIDYLTVAGYIIYLHFLFSLLQL